MNKDDQLTHWLNPESPAGSNQFSATSNRDWIEAERSRINEAGGSAFIVEDAKGMIALSRRPQPARQDDPTPTKKAII
jgi:hypothetical protein